MFSDVTDNASFFIDWPVTHISVPYALCVKPLNFKQTAGEFLVILDLKFSKGYGVLSYYWKTVTIYNGFIEKSYYLIRVI